MMWFKGSLTSGIDFSCLSTLRPEPVVFNMTEKITRPVNRLKYHIICLLAENDHTPDIDFGLGVIHMNFGPSYGMFMVNRSTLDYVFVDLIEYDWYDQIIVRSCAPGEEKWLVNVFTLPQFENFIIMRFGFTQPAVRSESSNVATIGHDDSEWEVMPQELF